MEIELHLGLAKSWHIDLVLGCSPNVPLAILQASATWGVLSRVKKRVICSISIISAQSPNSAKKLSKCVKSVHRNEVSLFATANIHC